MNRSVLSSWSISSAVSQTVSGARVSLLPLVLSVGVIILVGAGLVGCDDVPIGPEAKEAPSGPLPGEPTVCDIAARLTELHCTGCHGGSTAPLLTADGLRAAIGSESARYPGKTLIVAGDASASLLFAKVNGPANDEGARMPLGGAALDPELVAMLGAWIDAGAPATCEAAGEDENGGGTGAGGIAPGAPLDVGSPPRGFAATLPDFVGGSRCSTGQWWQHEGDEEEGPTMNPGRACIACHSASDDEDAPRFAFAGTVMGGLHDDDLCRGVPGTTVQILDENDVAVATATTNAAGNFFLSGPTVRPFRVRLAYQGRTREMYGHQDAVGDCMACHTAAGRNGAPGRVVAP
jgi:hypothetical protein